MLKLYENLHIFHFQKRIETIRRNTVVTLLEAAAMNQSDQFNWSESQSKL